LREYFFQAVANSSWSNVGYLVALDIRKSPSADKILKELGILSNLYGIGVISLDSENLYDYSSHEILFLAKEKTEIDFAMINRLYEVNKDFKKYINSINIAYKTGKLDARDFDFDKNLE
jgi:hypothetical protein